jgi:hypothetical protein
MWIWSAHQGKPITFCQFRQCLLSTVQAKSSFVHADPDYKVRMKGAEVLAAAAKSAAASEAPQNRSASTRSPNARGNASNPEAQIEQIMEGVAIRVQKPGLTTKVWDLWSIIIVINRNSAVEVRWGQ